MHKIRLELETLSVESFDTAPSDREDGTVFGHATYQVGCSYGRTCLESACDGTCGTSPSDCGTCQTDCGTCQTDCG
ncbi:MAG TPA: hypothetical protein VF541_09950, partial [Longimicrobium sp.]